MRGSCLTRVLGNKGGTGRVGNGVGEPMFLFLFFMAEY